MKFWQETQQKASSCWKNPMLIAKQDNFPTIVVLNYSIVVHNGNANQLMLGVDPIGAYPRLDASVYWFSDLLAQSPPGYDRHAFS